VAQPPTLATSATSAGFRRDIGDIGGVMLPHRRHRPPPSAPMSADVTDVAAMWRICEVPSPQFGYENATEPTEGQATSAPMSRRKRDVNGDFGHVPMSPMSPMSWAPGHYHFCIDL
jgi:hypothetical protein